MAVDSCPVLPAVLLLEGFLFCFVFLNLVDCSSKRDQGPFKKKVFHAHYPGLLLKNNFSSAVTRKVQESQP